MTSVNSYIEHESETSLNVIGTRLNRKRHWNASLVMFIPLGVQTLMQK